MTVLDQVNTKAEAEAPLERVASCTDVQTALPPARASRTNEQSMGRAVKLGILIGLPATFLATFLIGFLGGAGVGASAAIGLWVGVFGSGTYLGGIFFLPSGPDSTGHDAK
jgi:hypothetical protein